MTTAPVQDLEIYQDLRHITSTVSASIEIIWPDQARAWLENNNTHNRKIKKVHLQRLVDDFNNGRFRFTGASISFSSDGTLIDGQHRLLACVTSGQPFVSIVVRGLEPKAQDHTDLAAVRSVGDILQLNGLNNGIMVGTLAGLDLSYQTWPNHVWTGAQMPTKAQSVAHAVEHEAEFQEAVVAGRKALSAIGAHATAYSELYVLVHRSKYSDAWDDFHEGVCLGAGLSDGDARLTLRNYIMRGKTEYGSWGRQRELALYIRSFNAYVNGEELRMLKFTKENLPMPTIAGS
jgi:hypothetical protein